MSDHEKQKAAEVIAPWPVGQGLLFWQNETSGMMRSTVLAYLQGEEMTDGQILLMRWYLRQWIHAPVWEGPDIDELRNLADAIDSRSAIRKWIHRALDAGIDPL